MILFFIDMAYGIVTILTKEYTDFRLYNFVFQENILEVCKT